MVPKDRKLIDLNQTDEALYEWVKVQPHQEYQFKRIASQEQEMREAADEFIKELQLMRAGVA